MTDGGEEGQQGRRGRKKRGNDANEVFLLGLAVLRLVRRLVVDMNVSALDAWQLFELVLQRLRDVVSDGQRRVAVHDQVNLDDVVRPAVVDCDGVDRFDLFGEVEGFVHDEVGELARSSSSGQFGEAVGASATPGVAEDGGNNKCTGGVLQ